MPTRRITRINELLRREIGEALFRLVGEESFDPGAVTVTHVEVGTNLRTAVVRVSVRGDDAVKRRMLSVIRRNRIRIQNQVGRDVVMKFNPRLAFELDSSLEDGDRVLDMLKGLDHTENPDNA